MKGSTRSPHDQRKSTGCSTCLRAWFEVSKHTGETKVPRPFAGRATATAACRSARYGVLHVPGYREHGCSERRRQGVGAGRGAPGPSGLDAAESKHPLERLRGSCGRADSTATSRRGARSAEVREVPQQEFDGSSADISPRLPETYTRSRWSARTCPAGLRAGRDGSRHDDGRSAFARPRAGVRRVRHGGGLALDGDPGRRGSGPRQGPPNRLARLRGRLAGWLRPGHEPRAARCMSGRTGSTFRAGWKTCRWPSHRAPAPKCSVHWPRW